ncbi:DUF2336 domain-containing protein [Ferrovibrio terrae]|uniref:DUF2336 domain-containing protein n=1 Tax=Ferrovibrio terrae TaxID=2594003 RepID=UPI0031382CB9
MVQGAFLGIQDVQRLLADPSPAARADTAAKVARAYANENEGGPALTAVEKELAQAIIAALARDAELLVRQTLAEQLKDSPQLPRGVALKLARDAAAVATPLLQFSPVFSDADLIELVQAVSPLHQSAIAGRARVSAPLADALVTHGAEPAVAVLMTNRGATVSGPMMERALDRFPDSRALGEALARHPDMPPKFAARLIAQVSDAMRDAMIARYQIPPAMAADTMLQLRERSLLGLLGDGAEPPALADLVADLQKRGQLSDTLLLRALAGGDLAFFEQGVSLLTGVPLNNTRLLMHDPGKRGLAAIYQRSRLPQDHFKMVEAVIDLARGFDFVRGAVERAEFVEVVTAMMLADFAMLWDPQEQRWLTRRRSRAQAAQRMAVSAA